MNIKDFAEKYFKAEDEAWYKGAAPAGRGDRPRSAGGRQ
jgi:hypothetical protein